MPYLFIEIVQTHFYTSLLNLKIARIMRIRYRVLQKTGSIKNYDQKEVFLGNYNSNNVYLWRW